MSIILLADDSPHAQRMGERILRVLDVLRPRVHELVELGLRAGHLRLGVLDVFRARVLQLIDPDLVIADVFLPGRSGFDLCRHIKNTQRHVRVILTAGLLETFDEEEARRAGCDAILKKPFEASVVMQTIRPLIQEAQLARGLFAEVLAAVQPVPDSSTQPHVTAPEPPDPERVEAAITLALDAALPNLVREITEKVLVALGH